MVVWVLCSCMVHHVWVSPHIDAQQQGRAAQNHQNTDKQHRQQHPLLSGAPPAGCCQLLAHRHAGQEGLQGREGAL